MLEAGEATGCWFDEPDPADRRSWAIPPGHGTYQGLDLELLVPADEGELMVLIEAQHTEFEDALRNDEEMITGGEPFSPRLHIAWRPRSVRSSVRGEDHACPRGGFNFAHARNPTTSRDATPDPGTLGHYLAGTGRQLRADFHGEILVLLAAGQLL